MKIVPFKKTQMKRDKEKLINQKFCRLVFDTIFALFLHLIFPSNAIAYFTQVISYHEYLSEVFTLHKKTKFSIKDFSSKYDHMYCSLRIWSHLLEKSLMGNFIFCAVLIVASIQTISKVYEWTGCLFSQASKYHFSFTIHQLSKAKKVLSSTRA